MEFKKVWNVEWQHLKICSYVCLYVVLYVDLFVVLHVHLGTKVTSFYIKSI